MWYIFLIHPLVPRYFLLALKDTPSAKKEEISPFSKGSPRRGRD
ncbi:MAG: hypothetical protein Q8S84_01105 [bacterium]|nr:hypothetical protein [bacterium]MDP3380172.1 hypothetical protein [bacterium]